MRGVASVSGLAAGAGYVGRKTGVRSRGSGAAAAIEGVEVAPLLSGPTRGLGSRRPAIMDTSSTGHA